MKKLNLGSGKDYKKDWINLDFNKKFNPDVVHDMNKFPYPFKKQEFDLIYCSHIFGAAEDLFKTLKEIERIAKPGAIIHIREAHFSNPLLGGDLQMKNRFGWLTFDRIIDGTFNKTYNFKIVSKKFNFLSENHPIANVFFSWIFNFLPKSFYERFLCWIFPVGEIEVKLRKI